MPPHVSHFNQDAKRPNRGDVLTKAVIRAAERLGVAGKDLAPVLGVSATTVSRMKKDEFTSTGGHQGIRTRHPLRSALSLARRHRRRRGYRCAPMALGNPNTVLYGRPAEKIKTIVGLLDVVAYLDLRKARV